MIMLKLFSFPNFKEFILDARPRVSLCEAEIEVRRKLIM
jgi:hypothetical protein